MAGKSWHDSRNRKLADHVLLLLFLGFQDRVSLCSFDCPGTHSVDQVGLKLTEICLPAPVVQMHDLLETLHIQNTTGHLIFSR